MDSRDAEAVAAFLSANRFPFHVNPAPTSAEARSRAASGYFWSEEAQGYWIRNGAEDIIAMRKTFLRSGFVKEAHYRQAWPMADGRRAASVAYAILRTDWENNTVTPLDFDDFPSHPGLQKQGSTR